MSIKKETTVTRMIKAKEKAYYKPFSLKDWRWVKNEEVEPFDMEFKSTTMSNAVKFKNVKQKHSVQDVFRNLIIATPSQGVYALVNPISRKAFLDYSSSCTVDIVKNISSAADGVHDIKELCEDVEVLKIRLLDSMEEPLHLEASLAFHYNNLKAKGYTFYNEEQIKRKALTFKVEQRVIAIEGKTRVCVVLSPYSHGKRYIIVGVFGNAAESIDFMQKSYPNGSVTDRIVWSNNTASRNNKELLGWFDERDVELHG